MQPKALGDPARPIGDSTRDVRNYLSTLFGPNRTRYIGHNPVAGWMIVTLLGVLLLIGLTGISVYGGEEGRGLLDGLLPFSWGVLLKKVHSVASYTPLLMIVVHVAGVFAESRIHRENLLKAMVTGYKDVGSVQASETDLPATSESRVIPALVALYLAGGLAFSIVAYFYRPPPLPNPGLAQPVPVSTLFSTPSDPR